MDPLWLWLHCTLGIMATGGNLEHGVTHHADSGPACSHELGGARFHGGRDCFTAASFSKLPGPRWHGPFGGGLLGGHHLSRPPGPPGPWLTWRSGKSLLGKHAVLQT